MVPYGNHPLGQSSSNQVSRRLSPKYTARTLEGGRKGIERAASDIPTSTSRGKETFFDGKVFDPENPGLYLKSLSIKRIDA